MGADGTPERDGAGNGTAPGPLARRGISLQARLALVIVALVALTAAVLGLGASAFVEASLRDQRLAAALRQAEYDLAYLLPGAVGSPPSPQALVASGVMDSFRVRAGSQAIADFGDGDPIISSFDLRGALAGLPADLVRIVASGQVGYGWTQLAGRPSLVIGGTVGGGPTFWFIHDVADIDAAVSQLRVALLVGALVLVLLALVLAGAVARGILRPIDTAGRAAARMAAGDLSVRVPVASRDELGTLAAEFNRMAGALESTITRLAAAEARNRRFVSDVAHELRTPLTALVAEASLLRQELDALPPDARRAGELLVGDVARLRVLVDELMELSRFDAGAETVVRTPVDLVGRLRALTGARLPAARLRVPDGPLVVETDPRRFDRIIGNLLDNARTHAPGAPVVVSLDLVGASHSGSSATVSAAGASLAGASATRSAAGASHPDLGALAPVAAAPGGEQHAGAVRITVADEGPGVAGGEPALERLFGRFEKADPARPGGSGLGLAIAREHATLLGATLTAAPNPGGGLQFRLLVPVVEPLHAGDGTVINDAHDAYRSESAQR